MTPFSFANCTDDCPWVRLLILFFFYDRACTLIIVDRGSSGMDHCKLAAKKKKLILLCTRKEPEKKKLPPGVPPREEMKNCEVPSSVRTYIFVFENHIANYFIPGIRLVGQMKPFMVLNNRGCFETSCVAKAVN